MLDQQMVSISVEAEATNIPESITVSVEGLPAGSQILAGQVELPADVHHQSRFRVLHLELEVLS